MQNSFCEKAQIRQKQHRFCLLCGNENPLSMRLNFIPTSDGQKVQARFQSHPHLQGYDGIMHGGVICALLDSAMTNFLFHINIQAVTGELKVKFLHSIPANASLEISADLEKSLDPLYIVNSQIKVHDCLMASAQAKFMRKSQNAG